MRETVCGHPWVLFGEGLGVTPMALFAGTFENRIDRKGRVSLPADFRAELPADGARVVYVYPSPRGTALEACDRGFMQRMSDSIEQFDIFSDEEDDMTASIVAAARRITIDTEGRIALPPELIAEDLRLGMRALGRITGRFDVEDLLDIVFRDFCIGK